MWTVSQRQAVVDCLRDPAHQGLQVRGKFFMRGDFDIPNRYCGMGILYSKICGVPDDALNNMCAALADDCLKKLGVSASMASTIVRMNDTDHKKFAQIADYLAQYGAEPDTAPTEDIPSLSFRGDLNVFEAVTKLLVLGPKDPVNGDDEEEPEDDDDEKGEVAHTEALEYA